jgi:hypothetical protein
VAVPARGVVTRCFANATGTTTGTITVAVAVNGGADICNGKLQIVAGSGNANNAGVELSQVGAGATSGVTVNEGDVVTFTPSGGTGASIGGSFTLTVRKQ